MTQCWVPSRFPWIIFESSFFKSVYPGTNENSSHWIDWQGWIFKCWFNSGCIVWIEGLNLTPTHCQKKSYCMNNAVCLKLPMGAQESNFVIRLFPVDQHKSFDLPCFQFSHSVMSNSLRPHEPQHARPPCPSPTPGVHPNLCPLSRWCHPTISSSVVLNKWNLIKFKSFCTAKETLSKVKDNPQNGRKL